MCDHELTTDNIFGQTEKTKFTRRTALDMMLAGGLASSLSPVSFAQQDDQVKIGYLPITDSTPLLVAHALGFFEEVGLDAPRPTLIRSWPALVESFASREFNLVHLLKPIPIWMRYQNKIPVKVTAWCHTNGSALIVNKNLNINTPADFGGKQIAVPFWYSMHNILLQMVLRQQGLVPVIKNQGDTLADNETNLQVLPPPEMPAALAARKIDGYIVAEPFNALGELKAKGKIIRFTGDIWKNHPCCVVTMHESDTTERPDWTQKVTDAVVKAALYAQENKEEVAKLLSRDGENYLPVPREVVERAINHYDVEEYKESGAVQHVDQWHNGRIDFYPYPYASATELLVNEMRNTVGGGDSQFLNNFEPAFVAQDLVDYRFVRNSLANFPNTSSATEAFSRQEIIAL